MTGALRFAGPAFVEWLHVLVAWNAGIVVLSAVVLVPLAGTPLAVAVLPLIVLLVGALLRLAATARRDRVVTLGDGLSGLLHRIGARAVVAGGLAVVLVLGGLNVAVLPSLPDLVAGMVGTATFVAAALATALGLTALTLLGDPARDSVRFAELLRLAGAVVLRHPAAWFILLLLGALVALLARELLWPALVLPALAALAVAGLVIPAADELALPPARACQPSGSGVTNTRGKPARSSRTG